MIFLRSSAIRSESQSKVNRYFGMISGNFEKAPNIFSCRIGVYVVDLVRFDEKISAEMVFEIR